jgi:hypothetical protein
MKKFIKKTFLFICYALAASIIFAIFFIFYNGLDIKDIPAPNLSDSYSYNEKMQFLHARKINAGILAVGSSMTLNNLNSEIITQQLNSTSYLNMGSFGMSLKDDFLLLQILLKSDTCNTLIITSNIIDFQLKDKRIDYRILNDYLSSNKANPGNIILETFNLRYYIDNSIVAKKTRSHSHNNEYDNLAFDTYGAVNFDGYKFMISPKRWDMDFLGEKCNAYQYDYLDSISNYCKSNNIQLLFFQSPLRQGLYSKLNAEKNNNLHTHIGKIETILKKDNHVFINSNNAVWNDSLFVDGIHLNSNGARLFTAYCFNEIRRTGR